LHYDLDETARLFVSSYYKKKRNILEGIKEKGDEKRD